MSGFIDVPLAKMVNAVVMCSVVGDDVVIGRSASDWPSVVSTFSLVLSAGEVNVSSMLAINSDGKLWDFMRAPSFS